MSADPDSDPRVGTVLDGNYCITRVIGRGAMSTVYEAMQLRLGKRMAIKILAAHMTGNEHVMARFHREAEIASQLGHPNLIAVLDRGLTASGEPYLVMEYLEGEDLEQRLVRVSRMPIEDVVRVVLQTASALGAVHDRGIVHRDLKPANIFLVRVPGEPDFVKVLDFGVSKLLAAQIRLTKPAVAVGTPHYMAPEQATGQVDSIDHRIDQWALACIAWEMLLGIRPFAASDQTEVLQQVVLTEPAPLTPRVPGLPLTVEPVLRRALRKRASSRYDSIREFSHAFASAATGEQIDVTPPMGRALIRFAPDGSILEEEPDGRPQHAPPPAVAGEDAHKPDGKPATREGASTRVPPGHGLTISVIVSAAALILLLGGLWWLRTGASSGPPPRRQGRPVVSPPMDTHAPRPPVITPEAKAVEADGGTPEPARAKRKNMKPAGAARQERGKKPSSSAPQPVGRRPLFNKL